MTTPGTIWDIPLAWPDGDEWKEHVMRPAQASDQQPEDSTANTLRGDNRLARADTPQYQKPEDSHEADPNCPSCIFLASNE